MAWTTYDEPTVTYDDAAVPYDGEESGTTPVTLFGLRWRRKRVPEKGPRKRRHRKDDVTALAAWWMGEP